MSRVEAEFAEVKQLIAEAKESIKRDLINEWAVTVAPHMKTTNREVQDLREQHEALKEKISRMLDDFTSRTTGTAQNITKRFAEQVNAAWTVVQDEQEKGKTALKRLHAVNETTLAKQQETINALLGRVARYDENAVGLYKSLAELDAKNKQTASKLDSAIRRFDQMTSM